MTSYRVIPMDTYPRRAHFDYFRRMAQPYAGLTVSVEITRFLHEIREIGSPFFPLLSLLRLPGSKPGAGAAPENPGGGNCGV